MTKNCRCNRPRAELRKGCLHILQRKLMLEFSQVLLQPFEVEVFETCALRRRRREKRVLQEPLEQSRGDSATCRPLPVTVQVAALMLSDPGIEKRIARPGIEADHVTRIRHKNRYVGYAANVDHRPAVRGAAKQPAVESGGQRGTLAAGGQVGTTKISDHSNAGSERDRIRIADLQCIAWFAARLVPYRLAVAANGSDFMPIYAAGFDDLVCRGRKTLANGSIELTDCVDGAMVRIIAQSKQGCTNRLRVRRANAGDEFARPIA